jgi:flagellar basal-body rod protein FlgG
MYRLRPGSTAAERPIAPGEAKVAQGFMEKANVEVVYEMVNMIEVQRLFEAYQKVMQTSDNLDREAISKVARRA